MKKTYQSPEISIIMLDAQPGVLTVSEAGNDGLSVSLSWLLGD